MRLGVRTVRQLQGSQLSVQALTRLGSVYVFLLASWTDERHLALIALQGAVLAIPYALIEALVGRPLSADLVPVRWSVEYWAGKAAAATILPVAALAYAAAAVALPETSPVDRLVMITPVLLQLPLEALFWAATRTRSRQRANLVPQLVAVGTLAGGAVLAALDLRLDLAAVPAQLAVLSWAVLRRTRTRPGQIRPTVRQSLRVGSAYCLAAAVDLGYAVALPSVAGRIVGADAIVVLRALELAFGPFHVALSATTREDIVAGRRSRFLTLTRVLTVALLLAVTATVVGSGWVRQLLADELAATATAAVAVYCGYKAVVAGSTWASTRHMIWTPPRRYLVSAIGSRVLALSGAAVSLLWVRHVTGLFTQLAVAEFAVLLWYLLRIRLTRPAGAPPPADADRGEFGEPVHQPADQPDEHQRDQHEQDAAGPARDVGAGPARQGV